MPTTTTPRRSSPRRWPGGARPTWSGWSGRPRPRVNSRDREELLKHNSARPPGARGRCASTTPSTRSRCTRVRRSLPAFVGAATLALGMSLAATAITPTATQNPCGCFETHSDAYCNHCTSDGAKALIEIDDWGPNNFKCVGPGVTWIGGPGALRPGRCPWARRSRLRPSPRGPPVRAAPRRP
ncbi:DUF6355 family natural product biosynthesis protein [Streptomyces sp. G5(2025)]|uniref:DUF6355 family natural product biosynthesis protein n=1 Tax=Streptomyces sp. G5(2025) TaxID=3406628 RepID=UPI003C20705E